MARSSTGRPQRGAVTITQTVTWFLPEGTGGLTTSFTQWQAAQAAGFWWQCLSVCVITEKRTETFQAAVSPTRSLFVYLTVYLYSDDCLLAGLSVENSQLQYFTVTFWFLLELIIHFSPPSLALFSRMERRAGGSNIVFCMNTDALLHQTQNSTGFTVTHTQKKQQMSPF